MNHSSTLLKCMAELSDVLDRLDVPRTKYSYLELLFSNRWRWVRRRSKALWVKNKREGFVWVKFSKAETDYFLRRGFPMRFNKNEFITEDYREYP
jgi:hypothetical protein